MTHSLQTKPDEFFDRYRTTLVDVISKIDSSEFKTFTDVLDQARRRRAQIFIFGNGGSASAASHFVCDLNKGTWCDEAPPFKVISLSDNVPLVMAYANDVSYNDIFTLQMRNFMKKDDLAIGVSSSGNSENVNLALEYAATEGLETFGIIGNKGGRMGGIVQKSLIIPSLDTQHIEDAHIIVMHCCMQWFMFHANKTCQK